VFSGEERNANHGSLLRSATGFNRANGNSAPPSPALPKSSTVTRATSLVLPTNPAPQGPSSSTIPRAPPSGAASAKLFQCSSSPLPHHHFQTQRPPTQLAALFTTLQQFADHAGLPHALVARAGGTLYFALLPASANEETPTRSPRSPPRYSNRSLLQAANRLFSLPLQRSKHATTWEPLALRPALMRRLKSAFDRKTSSPRPLLSLCSCRLAFTPALARAADALVAVPYVHLTSLPGHQFAAGTNVHVAETTARFHASYT